MRHFGSYLVSSVEDVRFAWRLDAMGKMELRLSWRKQPELETIIFFHDNEHTREVVVTEASSFTFTESEEPAIFSTLFEGFQLYHQVPYGALKGVQSFSVHVAGVAPEDDLKICLQKCRTYFILTWRKTHMRTIM